MNLEEIGFSKEELQQRVIEHIAKQVMEGAFMDEDGDEFRSDSDFARTLQKEVQKRIDATLNALAEKHVLPNVEQYIENLTLQTTNQWGEKTGKPVTFIEYLTQSAEAYMLEEVNFDGKTKAQNSGYSWTKSQTRISHLINQHLHYSIETAMKAALAGANKAIVEGIEQTAKIKLAEISKSLQVSVETK